MRFGLMGIGTFFLIFFLVIINGTNSIPPEQIDNLFETIDVNTFDQFDVNKSISEDANLAKFIKYTAKGIGNEFHGTYYLASWLNPMLPSWLIENVELLCVLAILVLCAPILGVILNYVILFGIALCLFVYEVVKKFRKNRPPSKKDKGWGFG